MSEEIKIRSLTKYETEVLRAALREYISGKHPHAGVAQIILDEMLPNLLWRVK